MKKNLKFTILTIIVGILASAFLLISYFASVPEIPEEKKEEMVETMEIATTSNSLSSEQKNEKIETAIEPTAQIETTKENISIEKEENLILVLGEETVSLSIIPGTIFYDALLEAKNNGKITFNGKDHPALGYFVTEIGPLKSGNGKDLLYYVNGVQAPVGVSDYKLKDGDIIEWKLE